MVADLVKITLFMLPHNASLKKVSSLNVLYVNLFRIEGCYKSYENSQAFLVKFLLTVLIVSSAVHISKLISLHSRSLSHSGMS